MGTGGPRPTRIPPAGHTHSERRLSRMSYAIKEYVIGICQSVKTADNWYYNVFVIGEKEIQYVIYSSGFHDTLVQKEFFTEVQQLSSLLMSIMGSS